MFIYLYIYIYVERFVKMYEQIAHFAFNTSKKETTPFRVH